MLAPIVEALDDAEDEPEVASDKFLAGQCVARVDALKERHHLRVREHRKLRGIDSANFDLIQQHTEPPAK